MKRLVIRLCLLMIIILMLPYVLTSFMSAREEQLSQDTMQQNTIQYTENGSNLDLRLDEYIVGIVAASVPSQSEYELLKAMAVVTRTLVVKSLKAQNISMDSLDSREGVQLDENSFVFYTEKQLAESIGGSQAKQLYSDIQDAVLATNDEIIYYNSEIITPLFHSVSAGNTRNAAEMLGEGYPYLTSTVCPEDADSDVYNNINTYDIEDILDLLGKNYTDSGLSKDNFFEDFIILERDTAGYVKKAAVGKINTSGEELAEILSLNSSNFYIQEYEGKVRIICKGKGHGYGLSLFSANKKAEAGMDYYGIINYFYKDIKIESSK